MTCGTALLVLLSSTADAQTLQRIENFVSPAHPSSSDKVVLMLRIPCAGILRYTSNPYRVTMTANTISVVGGRQEGVRPTCPVGPWEEIELGTLPAGTYRVTYTADELPGTFQADRTFTVSDARAAKDPPWVRENYSGTWWTPSQPGSSVSIWHNYSGARDEALVTWNTYTVDGLPVWYTFQPEWETSSKTRPASLVQTIVNRRSGTSSHVVVGTASLDFTTNTLPTGRARLNVMFDGLPPSEVELRRFQP